MTIEKHASTEIKAMPETKPITGVKAFYRDMTCRGFKFEEGKTYKHDGPVKACESGFHFCENPIDTFNYYAPGKSVFRVVSGDGEISRHDDDSKVAVSEISVGAEISLHDLIGMGIEFFFSRKHCSKKSKHSTGYSSASSATGYSSSAVCTRLESRAMAGKYGCIALARRNEKENRREMRCAETGRGDGSDGKLKAEVWYCLNDKGEFVEDK